jgi:hypothetical protein
LVEATPSLVLVGLSAVEEAINLEHELGPLVADAAPIELVMGFLQAGV